MPNSLDAFQDLKYTNPDDWDYIKGLKRYKTEVPEATQEDYDHYVAVKATGVKGKVRVPPIAIEVEKLIFNDEHAEKHGCTLEDALRYVRTDKCSITRKRWDDENVNYYAVCGATYVEHQTLKIKTAFSQKDFDPQVAAMMEVLK